MTSPVRRQEAGPERPTPPEDWQERLALRNWSLPVKLAAVLLVPTIFVVTLGVLRIVEQTEKASSYDGVQQAVALEDGTASLLGALDAERGAAAVYLASNRAGGPAGVQRAVDTSGRLAGQLRGASLAADSLDEQTRTAFRQAAAELTQLDRTRADVLAGRVDAAAAITRYSEATSALLVFDESLTREAADPSVAGLSGGLYSLQVVREQDAYVQAVIAAGIAAGRLDAPSIDQARNATLRRSIAVDDFRSAVGSTDAALADAVVGPEIDARDLLAQVALGRGSAGLPLQVSAPEWDRATTAVSQRVGEVSGQLRQQLQDNAAALQNGARNAAGVASVVLLLALMAGAAVVYFVARSLLRPLRLLRRTALDVAERRLPGAVRTLREGEAPDTTIVPTPITTREEIGQVARAFDQVHEQAVRLAAEQAGLRSAFNSIFINLSRRSQALVERQLRLIEQLENNEEDPEALSNLFQLDHLATRMRRNSENLLVLSGTDLSRRGSRPVPLVDVLRAGASEVEQYQRIDLSPPPAVQLLGRTASDVVHLVAELLENATTFSAPETRVDVSARSERDGSVVLEIADRGVGMTEEDLHEANTRLDAPPTVDVSASRRMGLFVVGRLATRHGIAVVLRGREDGGVLATATVPASAVLTGAPNAGESPLPAAGSPGGNGAPRAINGAGTSTGFPMPAPRDGSSNGSAPEPARSYFAPSVDPDGGGGGELPRRAARPAPAAASSTPVAEPGTDGPAEPSDDDERTGHLGAAALAAGVAGAGIAGAVGAGTGSTERDDDAEPDDDGDDTDDRTATVGSVEDGDDTDESTTVWRRPGAPEAEEPEAGAAPAADRPEQPPLPARGAHAWRSAEADEGEPDDAAAASAEGDTPSGRHGFRPTGYAPPAGFAPRGPWGPPQQQPGPRGPYAPQGPQGAPPGWRNPGYPPPPGRGGPPGAPPWGGPPRWAGSTPAPPPMWNGAPVVPPPEPAGPSPDAVEEQPEEAFDSVELVDDEVVEQDGDVTADGTVGDGSEDDAAGDVSGDAAADTSAEAAPDTAPDAMAPETPEAPRAPVRPEAPRRAVPGPLVRALRERRATPRRPGTPPRGPGTPPRGPGTPPRGPGTPPRGPGRPPSSPEATPPRGPGTPAPWRRRARRPCRAAGPPGPRRAGARSCRAARHACARAATLPARPRTR